MNMQAQVMKLAPQFLGGTFTESSLGYHWAKRKNVALTQAQISDFPNRQKN